MLPGEVLKHPLITEKGTILQDEGKYLFEVIIKANKAQVKEAVEKALKRYQDFRQIMEDITTINRELIIREKKL